MSFVSYAQNFEDVMLWRALKHINNGVYVDIGAQHPIIDSVSKAFYERGWRGMHIEPVPSYAELLRQDRPDEIVLQVALSDTEGTLTLNVIPDTGLSTAIDAYALRHKIERGLEKQSLQVPVLTLKNALKSMPAKEIHWLKIDVEGMEEHVLKGWDSQHLRPWIIIVEATVPNARETDYEHWDPILINACYQFVYFDGLNRFYVAQEHSELADAFLSPPNVFDDIDLTVNSSFCRKIHSSQIKVMNEIFIENKIHANEAETRLVEAETRLVEAETRLVEAETRLVEAETHVAEAETRIANTEAILEMIQNSSSWRITTPLRRISRGLKSLSHQIFGCTKGNK